MIYHPEVYKSYKFWAFLLLTGNFALLMTAWLAWLSCSSNTKVVIVNGVILSNIALFQFYFSAALSTQVIVGINIICLLVAVVLLKNAYLAWCQKEFV